MNPLFTIVALWRGLSRMARLWCVAGFVGVALLVPTYVLPSFADRDKAFGIRVGRALEMPFSDGGGKSSNMIGPHSASAPASAPDSLSYAPEMWFGTDTSGRSLWHRTLIGAGLSFKIVTGVLALALPLSLLLGAVAGFHAGQWPDRVISWIISLIYTIPFFLLVVSVSAIFRPGLGALPWIIGGVIWAAPARVVRAEAQRLVVSGFLRQERAIGHWPLVTFLRTCLPMLFGPAFVSLLYLVPEIIGIDAVMTLFGLGAQPPEATLGALIYEGLKRWDSAWWLSGGPTLFLFTIAILIHFLADQLAIQLRTNR